MRRILQLTLIPLGAAGLIWFSFLTTASKVLAFRDPVRALNYWPDPNAQAEYAARIVLSSATGATAEQARQLAMQALRRSPVNAVAATSLGLALSHMGNDSHAEKFMLFSEVLSRRELSTELWLIERSVQRDDVAAALVHYDRALRTSPDIAPLLLPVLVKASMDPTIAHSLGILLAGRPPWWSSYLDKLLATDTEPTGLAQIVTQMDLSLSAANERERLAATVSRLVDFGAFESANRIYHRAIPTSTAAVHDGGFDRTPVLPPLDWRISENEHHMGILEPREFASGQALSLYGDQAGEAARQLISLPPGKYQIHATVGAVDPTLALKPVLAVVCSSAIAKALVLISFPSVVGSTRIAGTFAVPAKNCPAQWLIIDTGTALVGTPVSPWIDTISVRPW